MLRSEERAVNPRVNTPFRVPKGDFANALALQGYGRFLHVFLLFNRILQSSYRFMDSLQPQDSAILYSAISISIVARFIFMYLIYKNKSTNSYSLLFCLLNIGSSGMWMYYSVTHKDTRLLVRSGSETGLLLLSSLYIVRNKIQTRRAILPR